MKGWNDFLTEKNEIYCRKIVIALHALKPICRHIYIYSFIHFFQKTRQNLNIIIKQHNIKGNTTIGIYFRHHLVATSSKLMTIPRIDLKRERAGNRVVRLFVQIFRLYLTNSLFESIP